MKRLLLGLFIMFLILAALPIASAQNQNNLLQSVGVKADKIGTATNSRPFIFPDVKINNGDIYYFYVSKVWINNRKPTATMQIELLDKKGNWQARFPPWDAQAGWSVSFNGGNGPTFTITKIVPGACNKQGRCGEDKVWIKAG